MNIFEWNIKQKFANLPKSGCLVTTLKRVYVCKQQT
jgi:hypothetical protein